MLCFSSPPVSRVESFVCSPGTDGRLWDATLKYSSVKASVCQSDVQTDNTVSVVIILCHLNFQEPCTEG